MASDDTRISRRQFVRVSSATAAASMIGASVSPLAAGAFVRGVDTLRVGLLGCGGRGCGAAVQSVRSSEGIEIVALADMFPEKIAAAKQKLAAAKLGKGLAVSDDRCFTGLNAYQELLGLDDVDIVIHATPPGFRPMHLAAAVAAGKHSFIEKPCCVDPVGYRSVLASTEMAKKTGLAIVTGTQFRRSNNYVDAIRGIHDGLIGDILFAQARYCSGGIWYREREPGMSDVEYQLNNWYHFVWLCGDQIVEQAVHNLDAINWAMGGPPVKAYGAGGQRARPADSEIYDSMSIDFEYPNGAVMSFMCRQLPGRQDVSNRIVGTKGVAKIMPFGVGRITTHSGERLVRSKYVGDAYTQEHADLIASIRRGEPIVEAKETADSSLTGVMGRLAAYTGEVVTWDHVTTKSTLSLMPEDLTASTKLVSHGVCVPGKTRLT